MKTITLTTETEIQLVARALAAYRDICSNTAREIDEEPTISGRSYIQWKQAARTLDKIASQLN